VNLTLNKTSVPNANTVCITKVHSLHTTVMSIKLHNQSITVQWWRWW